MREPYGEGVASHTGPESCVVVRKGRGEALTGVHAGRALSREIPFDFGAPTPLMCAEGHTGCIVTREAAGLRAVEDPRHVWKHLARKPGDPTFDPPWRVRGVNPKGVRR